MPNRPRTTITGNLTDTPSLRFSPSGTPVLAFTVAQNPRRYDKNQGEWVNDTTIFMKCSMFGKMAECVAESDIPKGTRVIVEGELEQNEFETREGQQVKEIRLKVDEVGVSTKWQVVSARKWQQGASTQQPDPWGGAAVGGGFGNVEDSEIPF